MSSYIKNFKEMQRERTEELKHDHRIYEHQTLDQKLEAEANSIDTTLRINGQSIKDIIAKAKAKIAKEGAVQNHVSTSTNSEDVDSSTDSKDDVMQSHAQIPIAGESTDNTDTDHQG